MPSTDTALVSARPKLKIDGRDDATLDAALVEATVHLPANGLAHAEVAVGHWGRLPDGNVGFPFSGLRLGSSLDIELGGQRCFSGQITALEERYGDGAPRLVLLAEDALHRLARDRGSRAWTAQSLDAVLRDLAQRAGLRADVQADGASRDWLQHNESLLAFALRLLAPLALPLRLQDGVLRVRPEEADPSPLRLDAGGRATQVRLIADLAQQPRAALAQGFDIAAGEAVQGRAEQLQPAPQGETAAQLLGQLGWGGDEIRAQPLPRDTQQAEAYARGHLRRQAGRFVHGEIVCVDGSALRGGREVELGGVSSRLAGRYRVADCWHRFDPQHGLTTRLKVERPAWTAGARP